ncbi:glycosyltransferase [Paraburkholderia humisilvae]|uniref:D-inositol-3-phosphate glycosyltransferase n=1 Tax=Paraburkholderia humisilvae TaxID=627669 RepID=A0A6J5E168_9BURK|nr:glycosyltransferase [Paraburkholderia humisilvae]CAB3758885.1 D-inositol-3-phosphate glycosyltransferase [Paraburkholderia humisilvae]
MADLAQSEVPSVVRPPYGRVAIVNDWLVTYAGSERVLEQIIAMWPEADLFSLVDFFPEADRDKLLGKRAKTSFIQHLPRARTAYRSYLPLMPLAIEQFDLSAYDLVISASHAVAKGIITGPDQVHVSYVHSPIRYAWDLQHEYLQQAGMTRGLKSWIARGVLHYVRMWDLRSVPGVDAFMANSGFIARRMRKTYGCDATVVYPPIDIERFVPGTRREDFYLTASRMVPYKRVPLLVEAFSKMPDKRLVVIGDGPEFERAKALAGPNVTLLGYQPGDLLIDYMQRARGFVFAAEEDFGLSVVEAQACGAPVIAYGRGGVLETVVESPDPMARTGVFYRQQSVESIVDAIARFEAHGPFHPEVCHRNALRFTPERFRREFRRVVDDAVRVAQHRLAASVGPDARCADAGHIDTGRAETQRPVLLAEE